MSGGASLARFQNFVQSVLVKGAEAGAAEAAPARPSTAQGRFSSVRASADAVMQSPPGGGGSAAAAAGSSAGFDSSRVDPPPFELSAAALQSPMLRAIAARKTLEPLDLDRGGLRSAASAGHRRTKTAH
jgi:hypothetical protein